MILVALTGALAGLFHVLSGPDHLAAVAPLAVEDGRRGWLAGWTWGFGHASGVVVVALLAIALRDLLPPVDILSTWGERVVGVALIAIGLWALRGVWRGHDRRDDRVRGGDGIGRHARASPRGAASRHDADGGDAGDRGRRLLAGLLRSG